jgi:ribosome-binding protein aMBF1 (putative translation factor)
LIERIECLSSADRDNLFELFQEWRKAEDQEERRAIRQAAEEILEQGPPAVKPMFPAGDVAMPKGLLSWAEHVGKKIRELREQAGLTQVALAETAGLPQSHISRLENAEHSATRMTLEKIASALGVQVRDIDPCS